MRQRLHTIESAVAADADQTFDFQAPQAVHDLTYSFLVIRVHVIARRADEGAPARHIQFGNWREQGVEMDVRHAWIEQAAEAFDEAENLDLSLARANNGAGDGGVDGGRVAAGGEDANAFHLCVHLWQRGEDFGRPCP